MSETGKAVFLSVAPPDFDATRPIAAALRAAGIAVWFDPEAQHRGDESDQLIRRQIRACALFVPVVSAHTQSLHEGYFRLEWHLAEQRSLLIAKGRAFIVPVCLDATVEPVALVPEAFLDVPWSRPVGPAALADFVAHIERLLAQPLSASRSGSRGGSRRPFAPENPSIPDYTLIRQIGRGSYGDVWLARSVTGLYRAVKLVWRERFADAQPFEREFKGLTEFAAVSVGESIQLALLHVGRDDAAGFFYYVMELADDAERGRSIDPENYVPLTFSELRTRRGRVPAHDCLNYAVELTRVLAGLHAHGLVHRDIKPSNVILVNGVPKLADIGLVAQAAHAHTFVGTEGFVPPEGPGSPGADVYALGKVLYELCTGLDRHEFPQLPSDLTGLTDHGVLLGLNEIILRACDPTPAERYRDGAALLADLETLHAGRPVVKKSRWPLVLAALVVAALSPGLFVAWRGKTSPPKTALTAVEAPAQPPLRPAAAPAAIVPRPPSEPFRIPAAAGEKSLVVLPLKNLSLALQDASFHEDMQEEIITTLARLPDVAVLARGTTLRLANGKLTPAQFAAKFSVAHLLQGSVQRDGDRVQLTLELQRIRDNAVVWTKTFAADMRDFAALQTDVAREIARALQARSPAEDLAIATEHYYTRNPSAFDLFTKARRASVGQRDVAHSEACIQLAEAAMKLDPRFGAAAMLLAASHTAAFRAERDQATKVRYVPGAKHWAETASRLLPDGSGDREWAFFHLMVAPDYPRAVAFAENAARASPHDARHYESLAIAYYRTGRLADSVAAYRHAIALDPLDAGMRQNELINLARLRRTAAWNNAVQEYRTTIGSAPPAEALAAQRYALTGEVPADFRTLSYTAQIDWLWRTRKFDDLATLAAIELPKPKSGMGEIFTLKSRWCEALQRAGRRDEALPLAADTLNLAEDIATKPSIDPSLHELRLGRAHALLGQADSAVAAMRRGVEAVSPSTQQNDRWDRDSKLAELYAYLGRTRDCVALLADLLRTPSGLTVPMLRVGPEWDNLREDAGFQALLADPKNNAPL